MARTFEPDGILVRLNEGSGRGQALDHAGGASVSWTRIVSRAVVNEVNSGFRGLKELGNAKMPDEFRNF